MWHMYNSSENRKTQDQNSNWEGNLKCSVPFEKGRGRSVVKVYAKYTWNGSVKDGGKKKFTQ